MQNSKNVNDKVCPSCGFVLEKKTNDKVCPSCGGVLEYYFHKFWGWVFGSCLRCKACGKKWSNDRPIF